ncbi:MAG: hypothetical protein PWR01_2777 [Clostridiales bacterium]|nr:hypothetical protein [Clostridiales bacterium]MDN5281704.1 hypothetical protein [Candidatus Ozemobacter sp.]
MKAKFAIVFACAIVLFLFSGCGSSDGGLGDWIQPTPVTVVSDIEGKVLAPVISANGISSLRPLMMSVQGTKVFVEEKPEYYAQADETGKFIIKNVPAGKYHLVAELVSGITAYKQKSDQINLTGEFATLLITNPVQLLPAPHKVRVNISDLKTGTPVTGARITVWGRDYMPSASGEIEIGPLPTGIWPAKVKAAGYRDNNFLLGFDSKKAAVLYVKLTPLTSVDPNRAPIVEIEQGFSTIKTNGQGNLIANGFDPDGDQISYIWKASSGYFLQNSGASTVFTAPPTDGQVEITLTAKDSKGAETKCVLMLDILAGGGLPPNSNNHAPYAATDPRPENLSTNMSAEVVLRWAASDPDNDNLTYDVFLAERGNELVLVAEDITQNTYKLVNLKANTTYFWMIICRDVYGAISKDSQTWQFATGDLNNFAPYQPANPFPEDLAIDQLPSLQFSWTGGDPDLDDVISYSFYIGEDSANLALATMTRQTSFQLADLELGKTYYWQIIAADNRGKETPGPVWQFMTYAPPNRAPEDPVLLYPASGATNISIDVQTRWEANDPDGDAVTFDVYLGSEFPLAKVSENISAPVYTPSPYLHNSTRYYLQVIARDERGLTNENSPVWSFTTTEKVNLQPNVPEAVYPADSSANVSLQPVFSWTGGDSDGDKVTYSFYLDVVSPPVALLADGLEVERYALSTELVEGKQYYWKIVARDSAEHEVQSPIFSFFTNTDSDLIAPEIVSVVPEDNSVDVAYEGEVRVVFNEPVNQSVALSAFSFVPATEGTWTWENEATARFWPKEPWLPGSYHKFVIADNIVRDLAGNLMLKGKTCRFTIKSDLPVPAGFKSTAFPMSASAGDTIEVSVPELVSGRKSYAVVVSGQTSADYTIRANIQNDWLKSDGRAAFREFEKLLADRPFPKIMTDRSSLRTSLRASQTVGTEQSFYIPAYGSIATSTAYPGNRIDATCYGLTENVYVYVDNAIDSPSSVLISEVRKKFEEGILPKVRDVFGNEPDVGPDGESRLTILLTDSMSSGIAGIFYGADLFANDPNDVQLKESNGRKIFYLKYSLDSDITRYGTMAHEFQHMVNFWQKRNNAGPGIFEATWLNEGLSKYSEEVCGYGILQGDENTALLIKLSQENFNNLSLTEWNGINSYGLSYLFVRFLAQENRYGTTYREITRALVRSSRTGIENVETVTGEDFTQTLSRWAVSLYVNDYQSEDPQEYGMNGLNLSGSYSGVGLPGFVPSELATGNSFDVSLPANGIRGYYRQSSGSAETVFEIDGFNNEVKIWLYDER